MSRSTVGWREFDSRVRLGGNPTIAARLYWRAVPPGGRIHAFWILATDGQLDRSICGGASKLGTKNLMHLPRLRVSPCQNCSKALGQMGYLR